MEMDVLTVGVGLFSFGIFLLIHLITFRWVRPEHLLKSLLVCVITILGLPVLLMWIFYVSKTMDMTFQAWMCAGASALVIQGLLCLAYVLCVFGPYETSIRMRLVREVAGGGPEGVSLEKILGRYNVETMVNVRLQRLVGSGDIIEKDGLYRMGRVKNFFFAFDAIAGVLKKWINR
jgi:hypothetical protein